MLCYLFAAGWEISCPEEEIQANPAGARQQTGWDGGGRAETSVSGQSSVCGAVGRGRSCDFLSSTEGTPGRGDAVRRGRQRRRGEVQTVQQARLISAPRPLFTWVFVHSAKRLHRKGGFMASHKGQSRLKRIEALCHLWNKILSAGLKHNNPPVALLHIVAAVNLSI